MIFYRARPVGGELRAGDDASAVRVFAPHELPLLPFRTHREMVAQWLEGRASQALRPPASRPELTLRLVQEQDIEEVLALLELIPANRALSDADWAQVRWRMRESDTVEVYVAELGTAPRLIIGVASLSIVRGLTDSVGLIGNMAVLPTYQRRGVGGALLKTLMQRANELNLAHLWVNKDRANDQARAFYAALGFEDLGLLRLRLR